MGTKKCVQRGFGYGESEYEVSFGIAPQNGELSPSNPQTSEPFNSPFQVQNPKRTSDSNFPSNLGSVCQNLWSRGNVYPKVKGRWLNYNFSKMANSVFFDLSTVNANRMERNLVPWEVV